MITHMDLKEFSAHLDATNLKLNATDGEICALCDEAAVAAYASVCVYPTSVSLCSNILYGTDTGVCTVIGFPHGRSSLQAKQSEIKQAKESGATEVDIVLNYAALRAGEKSLASEEIIRLCEVARKHQLLSKIIVETCFLNESQKLTALSICETAQADFIKTSTGFGTSGATVEDVRLFADNRTSDIQIKASGGIKDLSSAMAMIDAGATRLGVSAAAVLVAEFKGESVASANESDY